MTLLSFCLFYKYCFVYWLDGGLTADASFGTCHFAFIMYCLINFRLYAKLTDGHTTARMTCYSPIGI